MKKILSTFLFILLTACATGRQEPVSAYDADFKTVFQAALSTLKDRKFTIKSYDWNSGEIDAYLREDDGAKKKEIRGTVALEQNGTKVKLRMSLRAAEDSAPVPRADLDATENAFFKALDKAMAQGGAK